MRIRTIKPEFWEDEKVGSLSLAARLLFIATWNIADDEGLLRWTPEHLKAMAFRYDRDVDLEVVAEMMAELVREGVIFPYETARQQRVAYIINFRRHQQINRPSAPKLAPPQPRTSAVMQMYAERDSRQCYRCGEHLAADADLVAIYVVPRAEQGTDYPSNIRTAHSGCADSRSDDFAKPASEPTPTRLTEPSVSTPGKGVSSRLSAFPQVTGTHGVLTEGSPLEVEREVEGEGSTGDAAASRGTQLAVIDGGQVDRPSPTARDAVAAWHDAYVATHDGKPTKRIYGQVGREAKALIEAGNPPHRVVLAARSAGSRGFPTLETEYRMLSARHRAPIRESTTDQRVAAALALAERYEREEAELA